MAPRERAPTWTNGSPATRTAPVARTIGGEFNEERNRRLMVVVKKKRLLI
jgi:hypothetical protein